MDLWRGGWYASVENTKNGGDSNERIVEDIVAAASDGVGYCHWDMPILLHLFSGGTIRSVEHSVHAFVDGAYCRAHASGSIGDSWSISYIAFRASEDGRLADRQDR